MKRLLVISLTLIFLLNNLCLISQDKKQFLKYINNFEKRLDSIKKYTLIYEAETQSKFKLLEEQNNQLKIVSKEFESKKNEIEKLNREIEEKVTFIDSQSTMLAVCMIIAAIALISVIALIVTIRDKKQMNKNLAEKNELIKNQVANLKQKNKEITDSIHYAKKIQDAILPKPSEIQAALPNSFIYYRPKDIVSGDFYWLSERNNKIYFVTADCTGHGVPGALMSMLGISYLNEIVNEKNFHKTSEIIDELKKSIINSLHKNDEKSGMKDGMDMALFSLDKINLKLNYSAANNGLYIIRKNKLIKLDADKQPVSASPKSHILFNEYAFDLEPDDFIITYSDGFADQFGGPKGKKFKYKQLQELLIQIQNKPINTIPTLLNNVFEKWKGSLEQVDDVLIVGVKV